jgi:hypothetical protein
MFQGFVKRWLLLAPLVFALGSFGSGLVRGHLRALVAEGIDEQARALGVQIAYNDLRVSFLGTIQLEGVRLRGPEIGWIPIPRVEARVDLGSVLAGAPRVDRLTVYGPRVRLRADQLGALCEAVALCEGRSASRVAQARRGVRRGAAAAHSARLGPRVHRVAPARSFPVRVVDVRDLQLEVMGAPHDPPWLALYQADLVLRAGVDRLHVSGEGHLVSVHATTSRVPIAFHGDVAGDEMGLVVDVEGGVAIDTPGATVSFEQLGLHLGAHSEGVWLRKVVVLPDLIDFTQAWRAESVSAVLALRSGLVPHRVIVEGLKGELDLLALSEFAHWLADPTEELEAGEDQALSELRQSIVEALGTVRSGLTGTDLVVEANDGDIQLRYADGTTFALDRLSLALGPGEHGLSRARVEFTGSGAAGDLPAKVHGGHVEVLLRHLTAAGISTWVR